MKTIVLLVLTLAFANASELTSCQGRKQTFGNVNITNYLPRLFTSYCSEFWSNAEQAALRECKSNCRTICKVDYSRSQYVAGARYPVYPGDGRKLVWQNCSAEIFAIPAK